METKIEDHPNYGKDAHQVQREMSVPIGVKLRLFKATLKILNDIRKEIGARRLLAMLNNVKQRVEESIDEYDLSSMLARGLSENDLRVILDRMFTGIEIAREMGLEKARELRIAAFEAIANDYFGSIFPIHEYLEQCKGAFFPNFKKFIAAFVAESGRKGIQGGLIVECSPDMFIQRMEFCAMAEVADIFGDRELCFWNACKADDFFFPNYMAKASGRYWRYSLLAIVDSTCDFC